MSWREVEREVGVSASTMRRAAVAPRMEADGVLCMLRWLGCQPEESAGAQLGANAAPSVPLPAYTRVDSLALFAALDARRRERGLTWAETASEMGPAVPGPRDLQNLARRESPRDAGRRGLGARTDIGLFMAAVAWLGTRASAFVRQSPRAGEHWPLVGS